MRYRFLQLKFSLAILMTFASYGSYGQDTIFNLNTTFEIAKVIEVNPKQVKFKKFQNPDGPLYILDRRTISRIVYSNGTVDTISTKPMVAPKKTPQSTPRTAKADSLYIQKYRNTFYLSVTDPLVGFISGGYERTLGKGNYNLRIPLSFGLGYDGVQEAFYSGSYNSEHDYTNSGYYDNDKIFSTGIHLNYFPGGQRRLTFGFGPELEFGVFHYRLQKMIATNPSVYEVSTEVGSYNSFMLSALLLFNISERWVVSTSIGTGFGTSYQYYYNNSIDSQKYTSSSTFPVLKGGFQVGFKF